MFTVEPGHVKNTKSQNLLETAQLVGGGGGLRLRRRRHGDTKLESNKTYDKKKEPRPWNHHEMTTVSKYVLKQQPFQTRTCRIDSF